jgi:hypothetical protein
MGRWRIDQWAEDLGQRWAGVTKSWWRGGSQSGKSWLYRYNQKRPKRKGFNQTMFDESFNEAYRREMKKD